MSVVVTLAAIVEGEPTADFSEVAKSALSQFRVSMNVVMRFNNAWFEIEEGDDEASLWRKYQELQSSRHPKDLRDHFAGQALTGILATDALQKGSDAGFLPKVNEVAVAELAYGMADAMLEAREK